MFVHDEEEIRFHGFLYPKSCGLAIVLDFYDVFFELESGIEEFLEYHECERLVHFISTRISNQNGTKFAGLQNSIKFFDNFLILIAKLFERVNLRQISFDPIRIFYDIHIWRMI